jgi:ribosomal protein S18 acetylase RimI-like enzyme
MEPMISNLKPEDYQAFYDLNAFWIVEYFEMEPIDQEILKAPQKHIVDKGGKLLGAYLNGKVVGVCALKPHPEEAHCYELTKMGVDPNHQGQRIGWKLGAAALSEARAMGARRVFLESNTVLEPAINLYRKLGFVEYQDGASPYQRSNIKMELRFS